LDLEAREEAMEEAIVHALLAYVRLYKQGRADAATPSSLAWYSSRQIRRGRPAVGKMNVSVPSAASCTVTVPAVAIDSGGRSAGSTDQA
jgi:hypothetical protein